MTMLKIVEVTMELLYSVSCEAGTSNKPKSRQAETLRWKDARLQ